MKKNKEKKVRAETIEEFLARGGQIEKLPAAEDQLKQVIPQVSNTSPELCSLADAPDIFGEKTKRTKPRVSTIDKSKLPESLHPVYDKLLKEEVDCDKDKN